LQKALGVNAGKWKNAFPVNVDEHMVGAFSNELAETSLEAQQLGSYHIQDEDHISFKPFLGVVLNSDSLE
jgi:hypothetical protein